MASAVLVPVTVVPMSLSRGGPRLAAFDRRTVIACTVAGLMLAGHFGTWVPGVTFSNVATATALVCTQPVWTALFASWRGEPQTGRVWLGIVVAVAGTALATGADFTVGSRAVLGDLLALLGGIFGAAYVVVGAQVRATLTTTLYTTVCYSVCAAAMLVVCVAAGVQLAGYDAETWLQLAAMTIGPQFLGHSLVNRVLATLSATVVSVVLLLEVPGGALLALILLDQRPPLLALPGLVLLVAGVIVVVLGVRKASIEPAEL
jgi:drug/metabolite transporter (DMT)-like permease